MSTVTTPTSARAFGIADIFLLLRRRALLILLITVVLTAAAAFALSKIAPRFSAEGLLMIESRGAETITLENAMAGRTSDPETVMSEIEVLKSSRIADLVIDRLRLDQKAEFNDEPSTASRPGNNLRAGAGTASVAGQDAERLILGQRVDVIETFQKRLDVEPVPGSRIVSVAFSSEDPVLAATIVNTLLDLYQDDQMESKFETVQRATNWLNTRVESLRETVRASEQAVEEFREQSGLLEGGGATLSDQEISQTNDRLIAATNERAAAQARLRQVRRSLSTRDGIDSAGDLIDSPLVLRLREQEAGVLRRLAELSSEYGERHPTMIKLRAEAEDLAQKIDAEVQKIVSGLQTQARIAVNKEANLKNTLEDLKLKIGDDNKALVTLRSLEREAEANRRVLEGMLAQFAQTSAQDDLASQRPDARIVARAIVPNEPSFPMKKPILVLVFLAAAFLGVIIALMLESLDDTLRSTEQLEQETGMLPLGFMPRLKRGELKGRTPFEYVSEEPATAFGESVRALFSAIVSAPTDKVPKSLMITSSVADEGKTTVATCLASMMARSGKRVILIDADSRRPDAAKLMQVPGGPGLMDVLAGNASLGDVIQTHDASGAFIISAGNAPINPPALLASEQFGATLKGLADRCDMVIVDSPPVMAVSDALTMANHMDATVLVARWGVTKRASVRLSVRYLDNAGASLIGGVLTQVDAGKYALYGYGDSGSYTGDLATY